MDKEAARPIWQAKQRWAHRFDPTRAKILIYKKIFLQTMKQTFFAVRKAVDQNFWIEPAGPTLLNLPDRTGGFLIHFAK